MVTRYGYVVPCSRIEIAGAVLGPDTPSRAWSLGLKPAGRLADAHSFFGALGDAVVTGPTLTDFNEFRAILTADA